MYTDGQMDDARLNVALALTAARAGAVVANHVEVTALTKDPATGLVCGAKVQDKISGAKMEIHAKTTVNATGVYSDRWAVLKDLSSGDTVCFLSVRALPGHTLSGAPQRQSVARCPANVRWRSFIETRLHGVLPCGCRIRKMANPKTEDVICASSGVHVVLPEYFLGTLGPVGTGLIIPRTKDGRVLFALPWLGGVVAGTTDEQVEVTDVPKPTAKEVAFIVETLKDYLSVDVS